jgi:leader peptidase (prepilin peptidase)/N-methyltransferase
MRISAQYPAVELLTGALFAGVALWTTPYGAIPAALWLTACMVAASVVDLQRYILPNKITLAALVGSGALLTAASALTGDWDRLLAGTLTALGCFVVFAVTHFAIPRGFGAGDAKFIVPIALVVGWISAPAMFVGLMVAFATSATVGVSLMVFSRRFRSKERHAIPFGPFLAVGGYVAVVAGPGIWQWYLGIAGI